MKLTNLRFIVLPGRRVFVIIWGKLVFCLRPLGCLIFLNTFFVRIWGLMKTLGLDLRSLGLPKHDIMK